MNLQHSKQLSSRHSFIVYGWLIFLTLLEAAIVFFNLPKIPGLILMSATTVGKSLLILFYFMHLKFDRPLVWMLPGIPLFLAILFVIALFPDIVFKATLRF
ncbi:MAG: cytochrome C oxidase subunit IV family protein [Elusimicrobiota bacterium]